MPDAQHWISHLRLQPHPEGGWFRETHRDTGQIPANALPAEFDSPRNFSTAIYFLLEGRQFSALHRIHQNEVWHFYDGSPLKIEAITPTGDSRQWLIGREPDRDLLPQCVIPGGHIFGASLLANNPDGYALIGCTVAPGFDFNDFQMPDRATLLKEFPQHKELIVSLTHDNSVPQEL